MEINGKWKKKDKAKGGKRIAQIAPLIRGIFSVLIFSFYVMESLHFLS